MAPQRVALTLIAAASALMAVISIIGAIAERRHWTILSVLLFSTIGFSIVPLVWIDAWRNAWRRQDRARAGLCWNCGYDLRGKPGNAAKRCPECGKWTNAA